MKAWETFSNGTAAIHKLKQGFKIPKQSLSRNQLRISCNYGSLNDLDCRNICSTPNPVIRWILWPPYKAEEEKHVSALEAHNRNKRTEKSIYRGIFQTFEFSSFCAIPKVGSTTQWLQFLRFYAGTKDYQHSSSYKRGTLPFSFDYLHPKRRRCILNDPKGTKAIFIRNLGSYRIVFICVTWIKWKKRLILKRLLTNW